MNYYKTDGTLVNFSFNTENSIGGRQGSIHFIDSNTCFKEYTIDNDSKSIFEDSNTKFTQKMFDYFKDNYNGTNMGELYDTYYDEKLITILGYTMKYYKETIDNILNMPITYIIDNFNDLYILVTRLTEECVRIVDLHYGNIINTDNKMIIIDYDKYYIDKESSKETISYLNRNALMFTFIGIFKNSLKKLGIDISNNKEIQYRTNSLFTIGTTPLVLKYRLNSYNTALDYIKNYK